MEVESLLQRLRRIQISAKRRSAKIFAGDFNSAFLGQGMSFREVREYQIGDDVRAIDWNVTARSGVPHVKLFEEEKDQNIMLLIDVSSSTQFGSSSQYCLDQIAEIAASLAFSAIQGRDKVGAILFSEKVEKYIPPAGNLKQVVSLIHAIISTQGTRKKTNLNHAMIAYQRLFPKKTIGFIISDFLCPMDEIALAKLDKGHELIAICIHDPLFRHFPSTGIWHWQDPETGEVLPIDTSDKEFQTNFSDDFSAEMLNNKLCFKKLGIPWIDIRVGEDYVRPLMKHFQGK